MCEPSYFELKARLRRAGFDGIRVYGGVMNYNNFTRVIDLEAPQSAAGLAPDTGRARGARLALRLGLQRYLWPNFMAIARRPAAAAQGRPAAAERATGTSVAVPRLRESVSLATGLRSAMQDPSAGPAGRKEAPTERAVVAPSLDTQNFTEGVTT
jgi:hypothetical protein